MVLEAMVIQKEIWVVAFMLLAILATIGLYNANTMANKQSGISVSMITDKNGMVINLPVLQGEELRKAELSLADLNERTPLGSTDKSGIKNGQ